MKILTLLLNAVSNKSNFIKSHIHDYKTLASSIFNNTAKSNKTFYNCMQEVDSIAGEPMVGLFQEFKAIKYKKAKTIEEAALYARDRLGITKFNIPDLDIANQVNLSLTRAFNKTEGMINNFDEVEYVILGHNRKGLNPLRCPAQTRAIYNKGTFQVKKTVLQINKSYFDNLDTSIEKMLSHFEKYGQISKNKSGNDVINLVADYRYSNSLNRYYRLYKQGKLSQKAKFDFENLLSNAIEEESYVLGNKTSTTGLIKDILEVDVSDLSVQEYVTKAKKYLLDIQKKHNIIASARENPLCTNGSVGLDGIIIHEQGHADCFKRMTYNQIANPHKFNDAEKQIARQVSKLATLDSDELLQETFSGLVSGDKYSKEVMMLYNQYGGIYV